MSHPTEYIAVVGSRSFARESIVCSVVKRLLANGYGVASGGATGADHNALMALLKFNLCSGKIYTVGDRNAVPKQEVGPLLVACYSQPILTWEGGQLTETIERHLGAPALAVCTGKRQDYQLLASIDRAGARPLNKEVAYNGLCLTIKEGHRVLGDGSSGLSPESGARFYLDAGKHPALALPEVTNPREVIRYARAAQRASARGGPPISFLKANLCYHSGQTYGCHKNYLICRDFSEIAPGLIPFLVTRPLFCGAGRLSPRGEGFEFSQRAAFLVQV